MLILPAMAAKARFYLPLVNALHAAGLCAAAVDLRAQGENTPTLGKGPDFGYRELIEVDLPAVVDALSERLPLHLFGHSLGASSHCDRSHCGGLVQQNAVGYASPLAHRRLFPYHSP